LANSKRNIVMLKIDNHLSSDNLPLARPASRWTWLSANRLIDPINSVNCYLPTSDNFFRSLTFLFKRRLPKRRRETPPKAKKIVARRGVNLSQPQIPKLACLWRKCLMNDAKCPQSPAYETDRPPHSTDEKLLHVKPRYESGVGRVLEAFEIRLA
jgi:hypothetical protein